VTQSGIVTEQDAKLGHHNGNDPRSRGSFLKANLMTQTVESAEKKLIIPMLRDEPASIRIQYRFQANVGVD